MLNWQRLLLALKNGVHCPSCASTVMLVQNCGIQKEPRHGRYNNSCMCRTCFSRMSAAAAAARFRLVCRRPCFRGDSSSMSGVKPICAGHDSSELQDRRMSRNMSMNGTLELCE